MKKYVFRRYSKIYPKLFEKEKKKIEKSLGKNLKIEHVGSTSIPGLGGKGIIDIAIKTPRNKANQFMKKLEKLGYESNSAHPRDNRRVFLQKRIRYCGKERRIHIHLTLNNDFWNSFIVFRDYLRVHKKDMLKYAKIKKKAAKISNQDREKYHSCKKGVIDEIQKKALKDFKK